MNQTVHEYMSQIKISRWINQNLIRKWINTSKINSINQNKNQSKSMNQSQWITESIVTLLSFSNLLVVVKISHSDAAPKIWADLFTRNHDHRFELLRPFGREDHRALGLISRCPGNHGVIRPAQKLPLFCHWVSWKQMKSIKNWINTSAFTVRRTAERLCVGGVRVLPK